MRLSPGFPRVFYPADPMKSPISTFLVSPDSTLREAMTCIDRNIKGIALVVDGRRRLVGTVTDGDIRRALLRGAGLEAQVEAHMQRRFTSVGIDAGRAEVLDLMRARYIEQVPILDGAGKLVGLHTLHDIIGAEERPNWAVIMAGGQGIRLRPVTEHIPKPMIKVAGRPILERLVLHLVGFGIRRIYLSVAHLGHVIEDHFGNGARFGCEIQYLREKSPMGTGGALSLLKKRPADPLLVMNGDLITQADMAALLRIHEEGGFAATMAIRRYGHQVPFGCVEVKQGRIVRLEEKPILERFVNAGIYVLNPGLLKTVPRRFFPITDLFAACLARKKPVGAFEIEEEWLDVGQREQLKQGRMP
jgi:dTDP-glucose pyrophosphorylase